MTEQDEGDVVLSAVWRVTHVGWTGVFWTEPVSEAVKEEPRHSSLCSI